jgi:DNA-binding transcriptional ArsR family regulator
MLLKMTDADLNQKIVRVSDPQVARTLTNRRVWRLMGIFFGDPVSLKGAADDLDMTLPALSYWVTKLLGLGLLKIDHVEKRQGRAIKYYRTAADHFFIPFRLTTSDTLESLLGTTTMGFDRLYRKHMARLLLREGEEWGLNLYSTSGRGYNFGFSTVPEQDEAFVARSLGPDAPALYDSVAVTEMDFTKAKAFQRELHDLYRRYRASMPGQQVYLVQLRFVPLQPE